MVGVHFPAQSSQVPDRPQRDGSRHVDGPFPPPDARRAAAGPGRPAWVERSGREEGRIAKMQKEVRREPRTSALASGGLRNRTVGAPGVVVGPEVPNPGGHPEAAPSRLHRRGIGVPAGTSVTSPGVAARADFEHRLEAYRERGLQVSVDLGRGPLGSVLDGPDRRRSARAITAAAFNISEVAVQPGHLERMARANRHDVSLVEAFLSQNGSAVLAPGTLVSLAGTQSGLETADSGIRGAIDALEAELGRLRSAWPGEAEFVPAATLDALEIRIGQMRRLLTHVRRRKVLVTSQARLQTALLKLHKRPSLQTLNDVFLGPSTIELAPAGEQGFGGSPYRHVRQASDWAASPRGQLETLRQSPDVVVAAEATALLEWLDFAHLSALQSHAVRAVKSDHHVEARGAIEHAIRIAKDLSQRGATRERRRGFSELEAGLHVQLAHVIRAEARGRYARRQPAGSIDPGSFFQHGVTTAANDRYRRAITAA